MKRRGNARSVELHGAKAAAQDIVRRAKELTATVAAIKPLIDPSTSEHSLIKSGLQRLLDEQGHQWTRAEVEAWKRLCATLDLYGTPE